MTTTRFRATRTAACRALELAEAERRRRSRPVEGTERELQADLVLLAMGFLHPEHEGVVDQLGVDRDAARQRQGRRPTRRPSPACSPPATPAAASR